MASCLSHYPRQNNRQFDVWCICGAVDRIAWSSSAVWAPSKSVPRKLSYLHRSKAPELSSKLTYKLKLQILNVSSSVAGHFLHLPLCCCVSLVFRKGRPPRPVGGRKAALSDGPHGNESHFTDGTQRTEGWGREFRRAQREMSRKQWGRGEKEEEVKTWPLKEEPPRLSQQRQTAGRQMEKVSFAFLPFYSWKIEKCCIMIVSF